MGLFRPHTSSLVPEDRPLRAVSPRNSRDCRAVLFLEMNVNKIDAMVAEKVMGLVVWEERRGEYTYVVFCEPDQEPWKKRQSATWESEKKRYVKITHADIDHHRMIVCGDRLNYSTDPTAMMVVVEKMQSVGMRVFMECSFKEATHWRVSITSQLADFRHGFADEISWPLAVCLAALRAVGTPESEIEAARISESPTPTKG